MMRSLPEGFMPECDHCHKTAPLCCKDARNLASDSRLADWTILVGAKPARWYLSIVACPDCLRLEASDHGLAADVLGTDATADVTAVGESPGRQRTFWDLGTDVSGQTEQKA